MLVRITNQCHMGCSHCFINAGPEEDHMTADTLKELVKFLSISTPLVLLVSGGEPTEHPDFIDIMETFQEMIPSTRLLILSNGMFLRDPELTAKVLNLGIDLQITNDPQYYPLKIPIIKHKLLTYEHKIRSIYPLGRAVVNNIPTGNQLGPKCFNLRSLVRSNAVSTMPELIAYLERKLLKFCNPSIDYNGYIHAGEADQCFIIGHITDDPVTIINHIRDMKYGDCNRCGLESKLRDKYRKVLL